MLNKTLETVIEKRKNFSAGSRVINCVAHMHLPITERSEDCHLCFVDMNNFIDYAVRVNEFLSELLDEVEKAATDAKGQ